MGNNSIMIDLDDPRSGRIAEVMSSKSAKKILTLLSEREMSPSEIASQLGMPINTITYNLKKLMDSGLIEKVNKSFWSVKGKKIEIYKISNKKIVISPKSMIRGVLPAIIGSVAIAGVVKFFIDKQLGSEVGQSMARDTDSSALLAESAGAIMKAADTSANVGQGVINLAQSAWLWFLAGALCALFIYLVWNFAVRKKD